MHLPQLSGIPSGWFWHCRNWKWPSRNGPCNLPVYTSATITLINKNSFFFPSKSPTAFTQSRTESWIWTPATSTELKLGRTLRSRSGKTSLGRTDSTKFKIWYLSQYSRDVKKSDNLSGVLVVLFFDNSYVNPSITLDYADGRRRTRSIPKGRPRGSQRGYRVHVEYPTQPGHRGLIRRGKARINE